MGQNLSPVINESQYRDAPYYGHITVEDLAIKHNICWYAHFQALLNYLGQEFVVLYEFIIVTCQMYKMKV